MDLDRHIEIELASRSMARENLLIFTQYTMPKFQVNWHHEVIANVLDDFYDKKFNKLMIFLPPQTGKSELSTRRFPCYKLGRDPESRIAIATYSQEFASKFNRDLQKIIESIEYQNVFPEIILPQSGSGYVRNSYEFDVVDYYGNIKTVGVGGGLTGNPVDLGIIDDPIKGAEQAHSKKYRDSVWDWYLQDFLTRLHNGSQQLITLTRWHEDDLAGRILQQESEDWVVVKLPAINIKGTSEYDPREVGEPLWAAKHSLQRMKDIEKHSPNVFMSMYQQEPTNEEGEILQRGDFTVVSLSDIPENIINQTKDAIADTAYTAKSENDPSAAMVYSEYDNHIYIWDYMEVREELSNLVTRLIRFLTPHFSRRSVLYVEPKASGQSVINLMKTQTMLTIKEHKNPAIDKVARVWSVEPIVSGKRVILIKGAWNDKFINDCASFPKIKHDEAPDLLAMAISRTLLNAKKGASHKRRAFIV